MKHTDDKNEKKNYCKNSSSNEEDKAREGRDREPPQLVKEGNKGERDERLKKSYKGVNLSQL